MSGSDFVFNVAKGKVRYYAGLPNAGDTLIAVLLKSSGLEADSTLKDYANLSALLAGTSDEATDASYSRKTLASVTGSEDDTNDWWTADSADILWSALAGAAIGKLLICYKPSGAADTSIIPLTAHSFDVTPSGIDATASVNNFYKAA
jgi:hypothetical protein